MPSLKPWMKAALTLAGTFNILCGMALTGLYHESCKLLGIAKPNLVLPLQWAGVASLLLGVGYLLSIRRPRDFRAVLLLGCVGQALAAMLAVYAVSKGKVPATILSLVAANGLIVLAPLAFILRRLYAVGDGTHGGPVSPRPAARLGETLPRLTRPRLARMAWLALLVAVAVPTTWAIARALADVRWHSAPQRPPQWLTLASNLPQRTGEVTPFCAVEAFPKLRFVDPLFVVELPDGSGKLAVLERRGRILLAPKNAPQTAEKQCFLDITDRTMKVPSKAEDGLLGVAFHPRYNDAQSPHRGKFFVHYTADVAGQRMNRLSRFIVPPGASAADAASEQILIDTPDEKQSHNGGSVEFGPDGFLYLALGDDSRHFPNHHAQNIQGDLFSGTLRIDVDCRGGDVSHAPPRQPATGKTAHYFIPRDNPFVGQPGALEEFYSIGFRNPWRMAFDRATGKLWVGDVGDRRREEINIAFSGSNHQWAFREGSVETTGYDANAQGKPQPLLGTEAPPVFEYERNSMDRCVIGGYVYRGSKFPELVGKYVFSDQSGRIQALTVADDNTFVKHELIALLPDAGLGVSSLGQDADGELYVCCIRDLAVESGLVFRLERTVRLPEQQMPPTLSATGLFADVKSLRPSPSLIPYEVNSPLWSDRAIKKRWLGLVSKERIAGELAGAWKFPSGTVFVKHFDLPLDDRETAENDEVGVAANPLRSSAVVPASHIVPLAGGREETSVEQPPERKKSRRLETRVLVRDDRDGLYGATYRWNDDETEAHLIDFSTTEEIDYLDAQGAAKKQEWLFPGRFECLSCHNSNAGGVLGFTAKQLHRELVSGGLRQNQLERFAAAGMFEFDCTTAELERLPKLVTIDDPAASMEHRVRSYLDANCSHCHRPGSRFGGWDARLETPLDRQEIIDGTAYMHRGTDKRSRIVSPGDLEWSFLHVRLSSNEPFLRMPPLGRNVVHDSASRLVAEWIEAMPRRATSEKPDDKTD